MIHDLASLGECAPKTVRNVHITHALCFDITLLFGRFIGEVNHGLNAQCFEAREVFLL